MTPPAEAALQFLSGVGLGGLLGILYGFLRPLRPRHTVLSDTVFMAAAFAAWVFLFFGICRGDGGCSTVIALGTGAVLWETTAGRWLRPLFRGFWRIWKGIFSILLWPLRKIFTKIREFSKKVFASVKKKGTIEWKSRRHIRRRFGG